MNDPDFNAARAARAVSWARSGSTTLALRRALDARARRFGATTMDIKGSGTATHGRARGRDGADGHAAASRTGDYRSGAAVRRDCTSSETQASGAGTHHSRSTSCVWEQAVTGSRRGHGFGEGHPVRVSAARVRAGGTADERDPNAVRMDYAIAIPFMKKHLDQQSPHGHGLATDASPRRYQAPTQGCVHRTSRASLTGPVRTGSAAQLDAQ